MKTTLFSTTEADLKKAASLILSGQLMAFPTETVYGIGAHLFNEAAIAKIFKAKNRPQDNPLIAHLSKLSDVERIAINIPDAFYLLAKHFFPGPLTIVLQKADTVPKIVSAGGGTIAFRFPSHPVAKRLIELVGAPLVAPSANLSGRPSPTSASHVLSDLEGRIAGVIDGGGCAFGIESTVISLIDEPTLLRPGVIELEAIEQVLGKKLIVGSKQIVSPGMKYRHYAPEAKVTLSLKIPVGKEYFIPTRETLYAKLREVDERGLSEIHVVCTPAVLSDKALMNRIEKAAARELNAKA